MKTQAQMSANWRKSNPEKSKQSQQNWLSKNRNKKSDYLKAYYLANRERLIEKAAERNLHKMKTDPVFALAKRLRTALNLNLRKQGYTKNSRTFAVVGMDSKELLQYLWTKFEQDYGITRDQISLKELHIDHIVPQSTAKTQEELLKLYHYSNLQFLLAKDNLSKGARIK